MIIQDLILTPYVYGSIPNSTKRATGFTSKELAVMMPIPIRSMQYSVTESTSCTGMVGLRRGNSSRRIFGRHCLEVCWTSGTRLVGFPTRLAKCIQIAVPNETFRSPSYAYIEEIKPNEPVEYVERNSCHARDRTSPPLRARAEFLHFKWRGTAPAEEA